MLGELVMGRGICWCYEFDDTRAENSMLLLFVANDLVNCT